MEKASTLVKSEEEEEKTTPHARTRYGSITGMVIMVSEVYFIIVRR